MDQSAEERRGGSRRILKVMHIMAFGSPLKTRRLLCILYMYGPRAIAYSARSVFLFVTVGDIKMDFNSLTSRITDFIFSLSD